MAHNRDGSASQSHRQQSSKQDQENHPRGVHKGVHNVPRPPRRSARLKSKRSSTARETSRQRDQPTIPQPRGQTRSREAEHLPVDVTTAPVPKRPRASLTHLSAPRLPERDTPSNSTVVPIDPIYYWRREHIWPTEYFELEDMTKNGPQPNSTLLKDALTGTHMEASVTPASAPDSCRGKNSVYLDPNFDDLLLDNNSLMVDGEGEEAITQDSKMLCQILLATTQKVPAATLFKEECFGATIRNLQGRNEAKVVQDISRLIVPSPEALATRGAKHLQLLIESVNECWNDSIPFLRTRPKPDFSVGFKRHAFTAVQLDKLRTSIKAKWPCTATSKMYFPFLTCEAKADFGSLEIADRQNAYSMTLAVRAIVELFRLVSARTKSIERFSPSQSHTMLGLFEYTVTML